MNTKDYAKRWMELNVPDKATEPLRASKYYSSQDIWFFTFPSSYFSPEKAGSLNILLQHENDKCKFYYLTVPFEFFRKNKQKFDIRPDGDKFDLHISAKKKNWLICERSNGVNFSEYQVVAE